MPKTLLACLFIATLCSCSPSPCVAQSLPDRLLVGYWHNWGTRLKLRAVPKHYDVINVAFATPTTTAGATMRFAPTAGLYSSKSKFIADVQALQKAGKKVLISVGGGNDPVIVKNSADARNFATSMVNIIKTYGFNGMDIDLEGNSLVLQAGDKDFRSPTTPQIVQFISGVKQVLAQFPNMILTAAPETAFVQGGYRTYTGVWGAYLPVLHALRSKLTYVHVQHYNSGSMFGRDGKIYPAATADFHVAMAESLLAGFVVDAFGSKIFFPGFRPDQVLIGLPASTRAASSGYTSAAVVQKALDYLYLGSPFGGNYKLAAAGGYPRFRGLMTWSINWDVTANHQFSRPHRAYLDKVFLRVDRPQLSSATGGTANFTLRASRGNARRSYALLASLSGTSPGTLLPGGAATLPLNLDLFSQLLFDPSASAVFTNFLGVLDTAGTASAKFNLPAIPGVSGLNVNFAYALAKPWDFASNATKIAIVK